MDVIGLHHVSVNTNGTDLGAMITFYRDVLGLTDAIRPEIPGVGGHWFELGAKQLHVVDAPSGARPSNRVDPVGPHFCVAVADLASAVEELDLRGIVYEQAVQGRDTIQIWFDDPAGNTIELQQDRGRPRSGDDE